MRTRTLRYLIAALPVLGAALTARSAATICPPNCGGGTGQSFIISDGLTVDSNGNISGTIRHYVGNSMTDCPSNARHRLGSSTFCCNLGGVPPTGLCGMLVSAGSCPFLGHADALTAPAARKIMVPGGFVVEVDFAAVYTILGPSGDAAIDLTLAGPGGYHWDSWTGLLSGSDVVLTKSVTLQPGFLYTVQLTLKETATECAPPWLPYGETETYKLAVWIDSCGVPYAKLWPYGDPDPPLGGC